MVRIWKKKERERKKQARTDWKKENKLKRKRGKERQIHRKKWKKNVKRKEKDIKKG